MMAWYIKGMKLIPTNEALKILKINKTTLYKWGAFGKVKMIWQEAGPIKARMFDAEELKKLASKLPTKRAPGLTIYRDKDRRYTK